MTRKLFGQGSCVTLPNLYTSLFSLLSFVEKFLVIISLFIVFITEKCCIFAYKQTIS